MNSICFFEHEINDKSLIELNDSKRLNHLNIHLKVKPEDLLKITILNKGIFEAKVLEINEKSAILKIEERINGLEGQFHLAIGLSRPQTIKKVLEHATTFGVKSFHLFKATLSEKSYLQSKIYENEKYLEYMIDGLAQSKTYFQIPDFHLSKYLDFKQFAKFENKFFLSLNSTETFNQLALEKIQNPLIAIGPERGWTKQEEQKLIENGFHPIGISRSTLRVEHAVFSSLGQLEMIYLNSKKGPIISKS
ncbi:hypothetical protein A9Q84_07405 [Halobacteriovorax marinus]|uniref:Ribosomal RNA small subunit methyltransferase E n=1 Tax=Halobacteriovorax marinus TaxID=97084 RepID=A0A1Y5FB22_9BACT|nr:hypothetical protein A9Q84_07405 [Halobacteriovorax marinus]